MGFVFKILSPMKRLRGTAFDIFGYTEERRAERALIAEYEDTVGRVLAGLTPHNHAIALELLSLPEEIRGFGHIKMASVAAARKKRDALLARFTGAQRAAA
jgi:indolepyruvate ferredoxin oxidoreductase